MMRAFLALATALVSACASVPPAPDREVETRIASILARRGVGSDVLGVIDNALRNDTPAPPATPRLVREILQRPLAALDTAAFFERSVPRELRQLVEAAGEKITGRKRVSARELLEPYLRELAESQRLLRAAARTPVDAAPLLKEIGTQFPSAPRLLALAKAIDSAALERANRHFLEATARFVRALRSADVRFPEQLERFDTAIGPVAIGTAGDDHYGPGAALILDPGGNDTYEREPTTDGRIAVIVDLAGDDRYLGPDIAIHALSAIIDLGGDDRYLAEGPGLGAAIGGAAVIVDFAGDDLYEAALFGEGAAAFGLGALIDLAGSDRYRIRAGGQGFGMADGVGLLWDRAGADHYDAAGLADAFDRGGGVSMAQGVGYGLRGAIGGGIGILRDDEGDDRYDAEMFAQGTAFFYGAGLLWDRAGDDRYRAVRYAQGCGVHQAAGMLRDDSGADRYALSFGVGQGMGLDLSIGLLHDGAGDDEYDAPLIAQGSATANGIGLLIDSAGTNRWRMGADRRGWGRAEWARSLPSLGLLVYEPAGAVFEREGKPIAVTREHAALGGPEGGAPIAHEAERSPVCPADAPPATEAMPLAEALEKLLPRFLEGRGDPALFAAVRRQLAADLGKNLAGLPRANANVTVMLIDALHCTLAAASESEAEQIWNEIERQAAAEPPSPFLGPLLLGLRARPAPAAQMRRILSAADKSPRCGTRGLALSLRTAALPDAIADARAALRSSCWREQAEAVAALQRLGTAPDPAAPLPSFLRAPQ